MESPLPPKAAELSRRAAQAFESRNFEYAKVLYFSVLALCPQDQGYRNRYHLAALSAEEGHKEPWRPLLQWLAVLPAYAAAVMATRRADWAKAAAAWERCLFRLPAHAPFHAENARCLEAMGQTQASIDAYQIQRRLTPRQDHALWQLGRLYTQTKALEDAREAYEAILKLKPNDPQAGAQLRRIAAMDSLESGAWKEGGSYRDKIKDIGQAEQLEKAKHDTPSAGETQDDFARVRNLAERCRQNPQDKELAREWEKLSSSRNQVLKDKGAGVARYPTNLMLRFELGQLLYAEGQWDKAIAEFQQAVKNPSRRVDCQKFLGLCFKQKGLRDMAVGQLRQAADSIPDMGSQKKEILYELGCLCEEAGKKAEARAYFEKIYRVDISYRDVAKKVEN